MNIVSYIAMFGWVPVVIVAFFVMAQRHRAVIFSYLGGWMLLPMASIPLAGLPDWTKVTATNVAVLLAVLISDPGKLLGFRPRWYDLPMVAWLLAPIPSSVFNGFGLYEGMSAMLFHFLFWGTPWFIGRMYLTDAAKIKDLGMGILLAAMLYAPLAFFEMWMAPQLHAWLYGFTVSVAWERYGIFGPLQWRPVVFMGSSFALAMFFGLATLVAMQFWRSGTQRYVYGIPMLWIFLGLLGFTILCKTMSAIFPTMLGIAVLAVPIVWRTRLALIALMLAAPTYMMVRSTGKWTGDGAVSIIQSVFGERRAESLGARFENEDRLVARALEQPLWGWGRMDGNWRVRDDEGNDITLSDGLWVISLGQWGMVGLVSFTLIYLVPMLVFILRYPATAWMHPGIAPLLPMVVVLGLHMIDNLGNAFPNPLFTMAAGAVAGWPALARLGADGGAPGPVLTRKQLLQRAAVMGRPQPARVPPRMPT